MRRILWILGLSVALFVYGGIAIMCVIALIRHRHLNQKALFILLSNGYVAWITFQYLLLKIRAPKINHSSTEDTHHVVL
jgi:hypothetical protein